MQTAEMTVDEELDAEMTAFGEQVQKQGTRILFQHFFAGFDRELLVQAVQSSSLVMFTTAVSPSLQ